MECFLWSLCALHKYFQVDESVSKAFADVTPHTKVRLYRIRTLQHDEREIPPVYDYCSS